MHRGHSGHHGRLGRRSLASVRILVGSLIGFVVFAVDVVTTVIRFIVHPELAERATRGAAVAMFVFGLLFIVSGGLAGFLSGLRYRPLRYVTVGTIAGMMVWSYLVVTWPLSARSSAINPPDVTLSDAVLIGSGVGAMGGLLLYAVTAVREGWRSRT